MNLTIEEVQMLRRDLEDRIHAQLNLFEQDTGTIVKSIYLRRVDCFAPTTPLRAVEMDVEVTRF